ncbi:peptidase M19 [Hyphomonas adhaerens MHS-3]|uniref:Peptidase M19 n=1 Tax=Hyphomonas adhaerens MHS-3 TaxID=1280949 RepID=A0A069E020_9PROT|nr:membrane dipeptidase [Hyphomonas adhaerens]KCZ82604.1 peptidase M19 [Hyphomonas adhaerens MHS-3]
MGKMTRRALIGGGLVAGAGVAYGAYWLRKRPAPAPLGFEVAEDERAAAIALLDKYPAIDSHAHPGRTFARDASGLAPLLKVYKAQSGFERRTIGDMREGHLAAACFAAVSDFNVLNLAKGKGLEAQRPFRVGEAWESYKVQIGNLKRLAKQNLVTEMLTPESLEAARASGRPGAIWTVEGGDFLEGSIERVNEAYQDGVRSITLVHYRTNGLADAMTNEPVHDGLTSEGDAIIREMNRLGMMIDLSHMAEAGAFRALELSTLPVMFTHTHISSAHSYHPRFISLELAKAAADAGGIIGAWPSGIEISDLAGFGDRIFQLVDLVGIDHVCLGSDMDANYKPVFDNYRHLPDLVALLRRKGMSEPELAAFLGGNFQRVWKANEAAREGGAP